eukprot:gene234-851_t
MEVTSLGRITTTTGKASGTRYPPLRSTRIAKNSNNNNSQVVSGNWSHVKRALANDKLYNERTKTIKEWFSVWDSPQRCKFFLDFLRQCSPYELRYIEGWFIQRSPVLRQDFTHALPRWISLYIFSYLDPKSLCRASQVCSHWQYLSEQDAVWMPKCVRLGWFLPIVPSRKEYGAWKMHYINNVNTLDYRVHAYEVYKSPRYSERGIETQRQISPRTILSDDFVPSRQMSPVPSNASVDIVHEASPRQSWQNSSKSPRILEKDHLSILDNGTSKRDRRKTSNTDTGTGLHRRTKSVPTKLIGKTSRSQGGQTMNEKNNNSAHNSNFYKEISTKNRSMEEMRILSETTEDFERTELRRKQMQFNSSSSLLHTRRSYESKSYSAPLSADVIMTNAKNVSSDNPVVLFLSSKMPAKEVLVDCVQFGVIAIPYDYESETLDSLLIKLRNRLAGRLARRIGFCFDGDNVEGTVNIIGGVTLSLASVNVEKMQEFWKRVCLHLVDHEQACIDLFWPLASTENGLEVIERLMNITGAQISSPIGFTGSFTRMETEWLSDDDTSRIKTPDYYFNNEQIHCWNRYCLYLEDTLSKLRSNLKQFLYFENKNFLDHIIGNLACKLLKMADLAAVENLCLSLASACKSQFLDDRSDKDIAVRLKSITNVINGKSKGIDLSLERAADREDIDASHMDQRDRCAFAVYDLEIEFKEKVNLLREIYIEPLTSSLKSNKAMLSAGNIKIIFNDCETILKISSDLMNDIKRRIDNWSSEQCLGDVYLQFTTNMKAYYNFLRNYPTALRTLERCSEEMPPFRAFLRRQRQNIESQNLRRLDSLAALFKCTPKEHKDRAYIAKAIAKIREIVQSVNQAKERCAKEEVFKCLQSRMKNSPRLDTNGRFLIKEMPLAQLSIVNGTKAQSNGSVVVHTRDVTLFLFNDLLICTRRYSKLVPFTSLVNQELSFETEVSPSRLQVTDVPDTKC